MGRRPREHLRARQRRPPSRTTPQAAASGTTETLTNLRSDDPQRPARGQTPRAQPTPPSGTAGDTIMGVAAFVPEHCGKRARATIRSDADFGSGPGSADRRPTAGRRLAVSLSWVRERTAYAASGTARAPCEREARLGEDRRSGCSRTRSRPRTPSGSSAHSCLSRPNSRSTAPRLR